MEKPLLSNFYKRCQYPGCRSRTEDRRQFFCDTHAEYRPLTHCLFDTAFWEDSRANLPIAVYVMGCVDFGTIKIGVAFDVMDRLATIQTGFPHKLSLFSAIYTERTMARKVEAASHAKLEEFGMRLNGEWFSVDPDDASSLVEKVARLEGVPFLTTGQYADILSRNGANMHKPAKGFRKSRDRILLDAVMPDRRTA